MKSISNSVRMSYNEQGLPELTLTLTTDKHQALTDIIKLKQLIADKKLLAVEVKQYHPKRSQDANDYCWVLCQKIAEVIKSTKELVYKKAIRDVGQFEIVPIKDGEPLKRWIEIWGNKGLGWFSEVLDDSKLDGYKKVISYWGSSSYNSREMAVLIDEIISQAKELDIETIPPDQLERMKAKWGQAKIKRE